MHLAHALHSLPMNMACMPHGCLVEAVSSCTVRTISKSLGCSCWGIRAATWTMVSRMRESCKQWRENSGGRSGEAQLGQLDNGQREERERGSCKQWRENNGGRSMEEQHSSASRQLDDGGKEEPELQRRHGWVCAGGWQGIS